MRYEVDNSLDILLKKRDNTLNITKFVFQKINNKNKGIMKKISFFLLIPLILVGLSCTKDSSLNPIDPVVTDPDPVTIYYTVNVKTAEGGTITPSGTVKVKEGNNLTLQSTPEAGFRSDSIEVNGELFPLIDGIYVINNISTDIVVKPSFQKTLSWYVMNGEWKLDSISIHDLRSDAWFRYECWGNPNCLQERITFLPNGKTSVYWNDEFVGDSPWTLDESVIPPTLFIGQPGQENLPGSLFYKIELLNENNLTVFRDSVEYVEDNTHFASGKNFYSHN